MNFKIHRLFPLWIHWKLSFLYTFWIIFWRILDLFSPSSKKNYIFPNIANIHHICLHTNNFKLNNYYRVQYAMDNSQGALMNDINIYPTLTQTHHEIKLKSKKITTFFLLVEIWEHRGNNLGILKFTFISWYI